MPTATDTIEALATQEYKYGFVTEIETESVPKGLNEDIIRLISAKKNELNSAVFSDGSFAYIPKGVRCPMELSTYFRINAKETGQFERTLIVAEEGAYVSYVDKCGAHTFPYLEVNNTSSQVEHEASTSKIGEDQIFYCRQRGLKTEDAVNLIVSGFCREVFRELPMEFAVEAQKLLSVSLEGSVG